MEAIINIYECVYRNESGKELYTKTWYAPTYEHAFRMAEIYRTVTLHEAFDFILKRIQFGIANTLTYFRTDR